MQARMRNPAVVIPEAMKAIMALTAASQAPRLPHATTALVHLRISQINGCSACVHGGVQQAKKSGETDDRLDTLAAWRDAPYFTESERAALALAEAVTRLSDGQAVSDEIWSEAAAHYDEEALAALILSIATTNLFNRLNATTRQIAGAWG